MPDSMSPENKPSNFQIGGVTRLPANEISMQVAKDFSQPEWKSKIPEVRMQLNGEEQESSKDEKLNKERMLEASHIPGYLSDFDQLKTNLSNLTEDAENSSRVQKEIVEKVIKRRQEISKHISESIHIKADERGARLSLALSKFDAKTSQKITELKSDLDATIEARRELVHENFTSIMNQSFDHLDFVAEKLMHGEFPYPYDSRQGSYFLSSILSEIKNELAKPDLKGESRRWMETLYDGVNWAKAQYSIGEGLNMVPYYYGALDGMAMCLRDQKHKISATDLKNAYKMDTRGTNKTAEASRGITVGAGKVERQILLKIPDKKNRGLLVGLRERREPLENIRETAINYQDDFHFWRNAVAAAAQYDYLNPASEGLLHHSTFGENELKLIIDLFAVRDEMGVVDTVNFGGRKVPKEILNFFTMTDTFVNRERYMHTMQALLELGARDKISGLTDVSGKLNASKYDTFLSEINKRISEISGRQRKVEPSFKERLSGLIIKQGITFEIGSAGAGPLSWCWKYTKEEDLDEKGMLQYDPDGSVRYKKDASGNSIYRREWEFGGISQAGDWYTPEFWVSHNQFYDLTAKLRSRLWPASCDARRKAERSKSPLEKPGPSLEDVKTLDPWLYSEVMRVIAEDHEIIPTNKGPMRAGEWRKMNKFDIDPNIRLCLKEMLWFWETPYTGKDGKRMFFPSFIPYRFKLSFFDQLIIKKDKLGKDMKPYTTFADNLRRGEKLSEQNWDSLRQFDWDKWLVNLNMSERWLRFLAEPGDDRALESLIGGPGSIKEIIKRVELGLRGWFTNFVNKSGVEVSTDPLVAEMAIVGQMSILNAAKPKDHEYEGLMNEKIKLDTSRAAWANRLTSWINMAEYMPPDKKNMTYSQTLSLLMAVTGNVLYRHALEYGTAESNDKSIVLKRLQTMLADSNTRFVPR